MNKRSDLFDPSDIALSDLAKSIGHPARIAILKAIAAKGGEVEGEIVEVSDMAPTTVIQHMRELKKAGLIKGKIFGKNCMYSLNHEVINKFESLTVLLSRDLG